MRINLNQIQAGGLALCEDVWAQGLDLETDIVKFQGPLTIKAEVSRITNAVSVNMVLEAKMQMRCSRCLNEFEINFQRALELNYTANRLEPIIDLGQDVREEIILSYPLKPLCKPDCKGLCPKCGKNLNEGRCSCDSKN